jgi:hypothetical protein
MIEVMKRILIIISVILFSVVILVLGYFGLFVYSVKTNATTQLIERNIEVGSEWQEIKLTEPLNFNKQVQYLRLSVENSHIEVTSKNTQIILKDGTITNPEIEVVDSSDKIYQLIKSGSINGDAKFTLENDAKPNNTILKLIRIKSSVNFVAKDVYWVDMNLK